MYRESEYHRLMRARRYMHIILHRLVQAPLTSSALKGTTHDKLHRLPNKPR